jgi:hypothetical protein
MNYKIHYIIIEGDKYTFQKEINKMCKHDYIRCGNMNTIITEKGVLYSQLMSKSEPIKE